MELRLAVQKHQQNFILFKYRQIIYLAIVYISVIFHNYSLIIQIDIVHCHRIHSLRR